MGLPFDVARCQGVTDGMRGWGKDAPFLSVCANCRRREHGHPERQVMIEPAIWFTFDEQYGCDNHIPTMESSHEATPNAQAKGREHSERPA